MPLLVGYFSIQKLYQKLRFVLRKPNMGYEMTLLPPNQRRSLEEDDDDDEENSNSEYMNNMNSNSDLHG